MSTTSSESAKIANGERQPDTPATTSGNVRSLSCFPGQSALNGPGLDQVWENVIGNANQAMDALKQGLVAAPGADPESDDKTAACVFCDYGNLCGASREGT